MRLITAFSLLLICFISCKPEKKSANISALNDPILFCKTVKKLNDVVLENNFPPMIAMRNYAYATIAAYEAMAGGSKEFKSLSGQVNQLPAMPAAPKGREINFALASLLSFTKVGNAVTFPEGSMMGYYEELKKIASDAGISDDVLQNTINFSDSIVASIIRWSKKDNYAQTRSAERYTVREEDGRWMPTPPMYSQAVEPHWMEVRCLVMDSCSQFKPERPPVYDLNPSSTYYKALMEVKNIGDSLTDEQKHIAEFWDDNPFKMNVSGHVMFATKKFSPGGHWMNIVGIAAKQAESDFNTTVAAYTQTSIALFDAFISCWDEKFRSNYIRPETAINKYFDQDWQPYIQTPPFPSYTSGHATISAAAAEVMSHWFGDSFAFRDTSLLEFGIESRSFGSFRDAAKEAAMSRLYGGIHYRFDNEMGGKYGAELGRMIVQRLRMNKDQQIANTKTENQGQHFQ